MIGKYRIVRSNDPKLDVLYHEISVGGSNNSFCVIGLEEHSRRIVVDFYVKGPGFQIPLADMIEHLEVSTIKLNDWADRIKNPDNPFWTSSLAPSRESNNFIEAMRFEKVNETAKAYNDESGKPIFDVLQVGEFLSLMPLPDMYRSTISVPFFIEQLKLVQKMVSNS